MRTFATILVAALSLTVSRRDHAIALPVTEHFLNLADQFNDPPSGAVPEEERASSSVIVTTSAYLHGRPVPDLPIAVELLSLDDSEYDNGEQVTFEVVLTYKGKGPLAFPTNPDRSLFREGMAGLRTVTIGLSFDDEVLGKQGAGLQTAFGADEIRGSLIVVQPGDTVRIRAVAFWSVPTMTRTPRPLDVAAVLGFSRFLEGYVTKTSANSLSVVLSPTP